MKNIVKNSMYAGAWVALTALNSANAAINFGQDRVNEGVRWSGNSADNAIQNLIQNALIFLGIIAVIFIIYAGFLILTAWGDEEKVKKGKTIIMQAGIGIVVIFLAYSIVSWLFNLFTGV